MVVSCAPGPHKRDSNCWCVDNVRYMFGKLKKMTRYKSYYTVYFIIFLMFCTPYYQSNENKYLHRQNS